MSQPVTQPGSMSFKFEFKTRELNLLELPIEVRKPNMAFVARTLSSSTIDVEPGSYFVTATLPAGQELSQFVKVGPGAHANVVLSPEPEDESPHETHEVRHFFLKQETVLPDEGFESLEALGGSQVEGRLRIFAVNLLQGTLEDVNIPFPPSHKQIDGTSAEINIHGQDRTLLAQLLQPDVPPINVAIPAGQQTLCTLVLTRLSEGTCSIDAQLEHKVAELLLRYREKGLFDQAATAGGSSALDAKTLLYEKKKDPVAAAVGAYNLLRFGHLNYLDEWTENLMDWFIWLPDGIAIRGEHLARLGKHDEALDVFIELAKRGLPLFSDGLTYVTDRLASYVSLGEKEFDAKKLGQAKDLVGNLQRFVPYVDFGKPIMTFTGIDPRKPDSKPLTSIPLGSGLDVSSILS